MSTSTVLQYAAQQCKVCHGDISLNNIVINRVWDGDDSIDYIEGDDNDVDLDILAKASNSDDDSSYDNDSGDDSDSGGNNDSGDPNNSCDAKDSSDGTDTESWDASSVVDMDEKHPLTTQIVGSGSISESDLTSLSSSSMSTATIQLPTTALSTSVSRSSTIKGYGLVIDYDNSFSITEAMARNYKINSVRHSLMLFVLLHLIFY